MAEKRKYKRYSVALQVKYKLKNWNVAYDSLSKDLSRGGIGLILNDKLKPGTPLELEFPPPDSASKKPITVTGVVVWSQRIGSSEDDDMPYLLSRESAPWQSGAAFYGQDVDAKKQQFRIGIQLDRELDPDLVRRLKTRSDSRSSI